MPDRRAGFTLLELLISLIIIAVIVVVVQNGFHIGVRAWETGESAIEEQQQYRSVLELIQGQLSSICPVSGYVKKDAGPLGVFAGDDVSLTFASRTSLIPGNPLGRVLVQYRVETDDDGGKTLSFNENSLLESILTPEQDLPVEAEWHVLLSGIREFAFEYLPALPPGNQDEEASLWQPLWEPTQNQPLPLAVRARFQADEESIPLYLVVGLGKR